MNNINTNQNVSNIEIGHQLSEKVSQQVNTIEQKINNCFKLTWDQIQNAEMEFDSYLKWKNIKNNYGIEDYEMDSFLYEMKRFHEGIPHGRIVDEIAKQFWEKYTPNFLADTLAKLIKDIWNPQLNNYGDVFFMLVWGNHISKNIWPKQKEDEIIEVEEQTETNFLNNFSDALENNILYFPRNSDELLLVRWYQWRVRVFKKEETYSFQFVDFWTERVIKALNFKNQSTDLEQGLEEFTKLSNIEVDKNLNNWTQRKKGR